MERAYLVTLTGEEILKIFHLLAERPYKEVAGIIGRIQADVAAQEAQTEETDTAAVPE